MDMPYLAELFSYPVKSLAGGSHTAAFVQPWGMAQDRLWMVVDAAGCFMTQREHPHMALLHAETLGEVLTLRAPAMPPCVVTPQARHDTRDVRIWRDAVPAADCGEDAAGWLTTALDLPCRLAYLADTQARKMCTDHACNESEVVSFADGFPVLLASRESLADLNTRLAAPIQMSRFRPNLVVAGAPAWAEDTWRRVRIGNVTFRIARPCERCIITTIDQATGTRPHGNEPLTTLGKFRRDAAGKIMFGQNLVPETTGTIHAGNTMIIIEAGASNVPRAKALPRAYNTPV